MKRGKIPMLAICAAVLVLLAACAGPAPDPAPSASVTDSGRQPVILHEQKPESPQPSDGSEEDHNPIPFFVPDPDPDDPDPTPVPVPERETIPIPFRETKKTTPAVSRKTSDPNKFEDGTQYFGRWIIQSRGIDVACYLCISQEVVDTEDAASFFQYGDQYVIADHSDQDFKSLNSCQPGDLACLETEDGIAVYVCTATFRGHNTEDSMTDDAGNSIEYGYNPGGITCYTCNNNWQNIYIVLFSPIG